MPQPAVEGLVKVYGRRRNRLLDRASRLGAGIILASAWPDSDVEAALPERLVPMVGAAQITTAALVDAYVIAQLRALLGVDPAPTGVDITDYLVNEDTPWIGSAVKRWRRLLKEGVEPDEARRRSAAYLEGLIESELRATEMEALDRVMVEHRGRYRRKTLEWQRVPRLGACGWCQVVADRLYSADGRFKSKAEWHTGCRCEWVFVSDPDAVAHEIGRFRGASRVDVQNVMKVRADSGEAMELGVGLEFEKEEARRDAAV